MLRSDAKMGVYLGLVEEDEDALGDGAASYDRSNGHAEYAEPRTHGGATGPPGVSRVPPKGDEHYGAEYGEVEYVLPITTPASDVQRGAHDRRTLPARTP